MRGIAGAAAWILGAAALVALALATAAVEGGATPGLYAARAGEALAVLAALLAAGRFARGSIGPTWTRAVNTAGVLALGVLLAQHLTHGTSFPAFQKVLFDQPPTRVDAWRAPGTTRLNAGNALVADGPWRDFEWTAKVRAQDASVLELRLRAPHSSPNGMALWFGADPRVPIGFRKQTTARCEPLGATLWALQPRAQATVRVVARGSRYQMYLSGVGSYDGTRADAYCEDDRFDAGDVAMLAAWGEVELTDVEIRPLAESQSDGPRTPWPWWLALTCGAALSILGGRGAGLPLRDALAVALCGGAAAFAGALRGGSTSEHEVLLRCAEACIGAAALLAPWRARGAAVPASARGALAVGAALIAGSALACAGRVPARSDPPRWTDFSGTRLEDERIAFEHPRARAGNGYLALHEFAGKRFAVPKPDGVLRVAVVGARGAVCDGTAALCSEELAGLLERGLADRADLAAVEVIDASWSGAEPAAILRMVRDVLPPFLPDVVVVAVPPDIAAGEEPSRVEDFLARASAAGARRTFPQRLRDELLLRAENAGAGPPAGIADWRAVGLAARERGAAVVFTSANPALVDAPDASVALPAPDLAADRLVPVVRAHLLARLRR